MYRILTAKEVADLLGVNKETIYRLARSDAIPYFKVGSNLRFKEDSIIKWINAAELKEEI